MSDSSMQCRWPPKSADEMREWQRRVGNDAQIARATGLSRPSVHGMRKKLGVDAIPRSHQRPHRPVKAPSATMTEERMRKLYAGRVYEDRVATFLVPLMVEVPRRAGAVRCLEKPEDYNG